jgi:transcriptional regulator with XRE-family HTH domain
MLSPLPELYDLAERLRILRTTAGISQTELARRLNCSQSIIGHWEQGIRRISEAYLASFLDTVDASAEVRDDTYRLRVASFKPRSSWGKYRLPEFFRPMVALEEEATLEDEFEPMIIPGVFQTRDYAYASHAPVFDTVPSETIIKWVDARMLRKRRLTESNNPLTIRAVLCEWAVRLRIGSVETHIEQLDHLLDLSDRNHISIRLLTAENGHAGIAGTFTVLHFGDPARRPPVGYVSDPIGSRTVKKPGQVASLIAKFDLAQRLALGECDTREFIRHVREKLTKDGVVDV